MNFYRSLILILLLSIANSWAIGKFDYKSSIITRSYPIAFSVQNDFGWGAKFWEANDKIYGYTRVGGILNTSGVVNLVGARVDFFPISILGVYAQKDKETRDIEVPIFDCDVVDCENDVDRNRVGGKFGFALGPFFLMSEYQVIKSEIKSNKTLFGDYQHSLEGKTSGDELKRLQLVAGLKINEKTKFLAIYISQEMQENYNRDFMKLAGLSFDLGNWEFMGTAGVFKNRFEANVATVLFALTWKGEKGVVLF